MRLFQLALLVTVLTTIPLASAAPHPFYDDGGNIQWRFRQIDAFQEARLAGKPVFVHLCKENHAASEKEVLTTLSNPELGKLINRYMVPIAIDGDSPPPELQRALDFKNAFKGFFDDRELNRLPAIVLLTPQGKTIISLSGTTGDRAVKGFTNVLEEKFPIPLAKNPLLLKQYDILEKGLEDKKYWPKAAAAYRAIVTTPGYGDVKNRAYDAMEKAQLEPTQELLQAFDRAKENDYAEARKLMAKVQTEYKGLPVADEAKHHAAALKVLETANAAANDTKLNRKAEAVRQFNVLLTGYWNTPYAKLAADRKQELTPPAKGK